MFDSLTKSLASNIEMELLEHVLATLLENNFEINKKTPTGLNSFCTVKMKSTVSLKIIRKSLILILMRTAYYPITILTLLIPTR